MASTGLISTRPTKIGDVLKHEYMPCSGYCRVLATVAVPADGLSVGAVLENTTDTARWTLVDAANVGNAAAVLLDERVYDDLAAGDHELAILVRGPSIVADDSLTYAADVDTDAERVSAEEALKSQGILTLDQV